MKRFELSEKEINNSVESIIKKHSMGLNYLEEREDVEEITNANNGASRYCESQKGSFGFD